MTAIQLITLPQLEAKKKEWLETTDPRLFHQAAGEFKALENLYKRQQRDIAFEGLTTGDRVTISGYTDRTVYTIIKRTAKTLTVQECKATALHTTAELAPQEGGFACHFADQHKQRWKVEDDDAGTVRTIKYGPKNGWPRDVNVGDNYFHDYNF